jgi:hypothetical protein
MSSPGTTTHKSGCGCTTVGDSPDLSARFLSALALLLFTAGSRATGRRGSRR